MMPDARLARPGPAVAGPISVLITAPWAERLGGAEEMLCTFLEHLDRQRFEPHVVLLANGPLTQYLRDKGIPTTVIDAGRLRQARLTVMTIYRLTRLIARESPDVILNWTTKSHLYTAVASTLAGRQDCLIWWQHGIPDKDPLDRLAAALPAVSIGCSSHAVAAAQRAVSSKRRTVVVHPGIPASQPSRSGASIRREMGLSTDTRVVGIVGRIHPMKGQDLFVEALALLRGLGYEPHGLIVGGDAYDLAPEYEAGVRRQVHALGLQAHVTMTGHVPSAAPYIEALDVLVCASSAEPFGIVLLEAMRAGVPVVSTPVGGPLEIIEDGVSGVLVGERTPAALAQGILRLLANREAAAAIGVAGRELIERNFTAEAMTSGIERVLAEIALAALQT